MENRAGLYKVIVWWAWLAAVAVLVAEPFVWELQYFRIHGGVANFRLVLGGLLLLIPACVLYVRWRRRGWYRYELPAIVGAATCLAAIGQPLGFGVGLLFFLGCLSAGLSLARLFGVAFARPAETIGVGFTLGASALIPLLFILGLLHAYYWPVFLILLAAPTVLGWRDAREGLRAMGRLWRAASSARSLEHPMFGVGVVFLAAGVLCGTLAALSPTLILDATKMHLPSAQTYAMLHALQPVLALKYSYFPQGFEVMMASAYALGGLPAAQMITPVFFLAALLVLYEIGKLCEFDSAAILCGLAAVMVTPFIIWDGSQVKNDMEVTLFEFVALYCCLRWRASEQRGWLMMGAVVLATSFSIKHIAAFGAVPLALLFVAPLYRKPRGVRTAAAFFLLIAVFGFYWHARTYLLTGDPLYPRHAEEVVTPRRPMAPGTRLRRRLEAPWRLQLHDNRIGFESPLPSPMGILMLIFAPLALIIARKKNPNRMACWFFIAVNLLLWGSRMTTLRYALAPVALLFVFLGAKVKDAYDQDWTVAPGLVRLSIATAFGGALAFALLGAIIVEIVPGQLPLLAGRINAAQYLQNDLPSYAPLEGIRRLNPHAAVLIVKGCPRAYAPNPAKSVCGKGGLALDGPPGTQKLLSVGDFQYVVFPWDWEDEERAVLLQGWNAEDVYADRHWRAVRVTPNP